MCHCPRGKYRCHLNRKSTQWNLAKHTLVYKHNSVSLNWLPTRKKKESNLFSFISVMFYVSNPRAMQVLHIQGRHIQCSISLLPIRNKARISPNFNDDIFHLYIYASPHTAQNPFCFGFGFQTIQSVC